MISMIYVVLFSNCYILIVSGVLFVLGGGYSGFLFGRGGSLSVRIFPMDVLEFWRIYTVRKHKIMLIKWNNFYNPLFTRAVIENYPLAKESTLKKKKTNVAHWPHRSPEKQFLVSFYIRFFFNILPVYFCVNFKHLLGPQ